MLLEEHLYYSLVYFLDVKDEAKFYLLSKSINKDYLEYRKSIYDREYYDMYSEEKRRSTLEMVSVCKYYLHKNELDGERLITSVKIFEYLAYKLNRKILSYHPKFQDTLLDKLIQSYKVSSFRKYSIEYFRALFGKNLSEEPEVIRYIANEYKSQFELDVVD